MVSICFLTERPQAIFKFTCLPIAPCTTLLIMSEKDQMFLTCVNQLRHLLLCAVDNSTEIPHLQLEKVKLSMRVMLTFSC